jgi:uncharacterized protein
VIVLDSGGLYACLDADEPDHHAATAVVAADPGPLLLSPLVLAEVDYLVQRRLGIPAEISFLEDVDAGAYTLVGFGADDVHQATALVKQYADLGIGITDASVAVIAGRYRTTELLCLDERHFRVIRPLRAGDAFRLRPLD